MCSITEFPVNRYEGGLAGWLAGWIAGLATTNMHVKRCGTHRIIESGLCRSIHQLENHNYGIWRTIGVELLPYVGVSHSHSVVTCSNCDTHTFRVLRPTFHNTIQSSEHLCCYFTCDSGFSWWCPAAEVDARDFCWRAMVGDDE